MTKWEYRVEAIEVGGVKDQKMDRRDPGLNNSWLNNIGEDGWELVNKSHQQREVRKFYDARQSHWNGNYIHC